MKYEPFGCPLRYWLGVFGDKWSLLILRDILLKHRQNYGEFQNAGEGISTSVLADRLNHLEEHGIIKKSRDQGHGKKFIYSLTDKGADLTDVILSIIDWSEKYDSNTLVDSAFITALRTSPNKLKRDLVERAKEN